ncbi:DNA gyrase subunit B [Symmachiella macrocystis]|uniref:DNA topoisomerase (ATP-hydrolyzing) n=2 Tax=Symmachiella macrocystis TaxID=2527985 RepID=A0A5C6B846_9PLAN|nr:DNA gyrase subunit B [Symmachiella macrocystis]
MYIGSKDFFGLVHYIVGAVNLNLRRQPTYLTFSLANGRFTIESDADLRVEQYDDGTLSPFESLPKQKSEYWIDADYDGTVLNAFSASLSVEASSLQRQWAIEYHKGCRESLHIQEADATTKPYSRISFVPDPAIFKVKAFSPYNFHSYLKRLSFLNPDVRFGVTIDGRKEEYHFANGIRDMFECVSSPYQLLHEPIHFRVTEDNVDIELIFAFQSWKGDVCWSFINKGRAVEGGTHETGLAAGLEAIRAKLDMGGDGVMYDRNNGIVGIMSLSYADITWSGCIKAKIKNPELEPLVERLVTRESSKWIEEHPQVAAEIKEIGTFTFPEAAEL